ncbi:MAG: zinc ribbon domain-containing protein [candidate division KSB1 bacterium]|nr:zinc ribbon domain-containing protein [candidate division KSB1 bacterium]MDZ7319067.1 zinc ribbon domain-containing protein [candidate division KSB1 bacterium]MDZ7340536.1 zinc ribbon domain-containing protein [candidate division KSB1 bacterium]
MPIYEYKCRACGHRFDLFQSLGASNENLTCPQCGEPRPDRIFSAFGATGLSSSGTAAAGCGSSGPFT